MKTIELKVEVAPPVKAWDEEKQVFYDQELLPEYKHIGDAGFDFRANLDHREFIKPGRSKLIPTGIKVELPEGYEIQVRPRSGVALKYRVTVLNTPGTIDSFFRGEIGVILINHGDNDFIINPGDRIAQGVVAEFIHANLIQVEKINTNTDRGDGAYGSTGTK